MDTLRVPDNRIDALGTLHSRTTRSGVVFGVRAQLHLLRGQQQEQEQQEEQQVLPLQRSLEVGQS